VNNSTGFPASFRGTLDVKSRTITDEMCIAAAYARANYAEGKGISEDYISPTMDELDAFIQEAVAVGMKAIEQGVARVKLNREELTKRAEKMIREAREATDLMMKSGLIPPAPES